MSVKVMTVEGGVQFKGTCRANEFLIPNGNIRKEHIAADAALEASKLEHQHSIRYSQADGADVVSATVPIHIFRAAAAGVLIDVEVVCVDAPDGAGDKKFTVDLRKCNVGSPTPATILSTPVDYVNGTADCTVLTASIASAALADGDTLVVVVTVTGSTGNQGQGLIVTTTIREGAS